MPEVSIILTSYNHGPFIGDTIGSVRAQTFGDWELLIIDDASQDNSQEIIQQYQRRDGRIRAVFHEANQKTARSINEGFDLAQGRYLMILSSDDLIPRERLSHQVAAIQTPGNENKVIVGHWRDIDSQGRVLPNPYYGSTWDGFELKRHGDVFDALARSGITYLGMQMMLLTRDHLAEIRFDERFPLITHEYKFALDLASRFLFHEMKEIVYFHRIHGDNLSCQWDWQTESQEKAVIGWELLAQHGHRLSEAAHKRQLDCVLYDALRRRDTVRLRACFLRQLAIDPILLQTTLDHYHHQGEGHVPYPFSPEVDLPNYTLADMDITRADLEAVHETSSKTKRYI